MILWYPCHERILPQRKEIKIALTAAHNAKIDLMLGHRGIEFAAVALQEADLNAGMP